ncbi:MAG: DUF5710 domain-containing protein [Rhodocyclaceae bacterium]
MRFDLKVPFAEKDAAKALGARWDAANKLWYVQDKPDMAPFAKWQPIPRDAAARSAPATASRPAAKAQAPVGGEFRTGSRYVEQARVCACLPWELCDKCQSMALPA